jgi:hypothetical protein
MVCDDNLSISTVLHFNRPRSTVLFLTADAAAPGAAVAAAAAQSPMALPEPVDEHLKDNVTMAKVVQGHTIRQFLDGLGLADVRGEGTK